MELEIVGFDLFHCGMMAGFACFIENVGLLAAFGRHCMLCKLLTSMILWVKSPINLILYSHPRVVVQLKN